MRQEQGDPDITSTPYWREEVEPFLERARTARKEHISLREHFRPEIIAHWQRARTERLPDGVWPSAWAHMLYERYAALPREEDRQAFRLAIVDLLDSDEIRNAIYFCDRLRIREAAPLLERILFGAMRGDEPQMTDYEYDRLLFACARVGVRSVVPALQEMICGILQDEDWDRLQRGEDLQSSDGSRFTQTGLPLRYLAFVDWEEALSSVVELLSADMRFLQPVDILAPQYSPTVFPPFPPEESRAVDVWHLLMKTLSLVVRMGGEEVFARLAEQIGPVEASRRHFILKLAQAALNGQKRPFETHPQFELSDEELAALTLPGLTLSKQDEAALLARLNEALGGGGEEVPPL